MVVWTGNGLTVDRLTSWYWTSNTVINTVAIGDVNNDGQRELVTGGSYFDGSRTVAQLVVWSGFNLAVDRVTSWYWSGDTAINSVGVGDVDADGQVEIVTGGYFNDGARNVAQVVAWNGSSLAVDGLKSWYWTNNTSINSIAINDVNGEGHPEIVTGGQFNDGAHDIAQLVVWSGYGFAR